MDNIVCTAIFITSFKHFPPIEKQITKYFLGFPSNSKKRSKNFHEKQHFHTLTFMLQWNPSKIWGKLWIFRWKAEVLRKRRIWGELCEVFFLHDAFNDICLNEHHCFQVSTHVNFSNRNYIWQEIEHFFFRLKYKNMWKPYKRTCLHILSCLPLYIGIGKILFDRILNVEIHFFLEDEVCFVSLFSEIEKILWMKLTAWLVFNLIKSKNFINWKLWMGFFYFHP